MATILDVAKLAGVSQGTASNVLNQKGNVSSEKIKLVEEAARELGFTLNEKAKNLRKGQSNSLAVILPNIQFKQYQDFYRSFKTYAERNGYLTELMLTNDNPDTEKGLLRQAKSGLKTGIALISCLQEDEDMTLLQGLPKICCVERRTKIPAAYYGFDYVRCGRELARSVADEGYRNIFLLHGRLRYSNERELTEAFQEELRESSVNIVTASTDVLRLQNVILKTFEEQSSIDAIVTTNFGFAEKIRQICRSLLMEQELPIYTVSPVFSLPERDYEKYELNYSLLGRYAAEELLKEEGSEEMHILQNDGYRRWHTISSGQKKAEALKILALRGPEAVVMKGLSRLYEKQTGIKVHVSVFSYDEIYEAFLNAEEFKLFDIFRIDVTWLSWFAEKILLSLEEIDSNIRLAFADYISLPADRYSMVNGKIYALPVTPSPQILLYRKDLFEDATVRRQYWEKYKTELAVPKSFKEFNQIASFFTRGLNEYSKVQYGTSLALGNAGIAATEFLTRFFSYQQNLYSADGKIVLNSPAGIQAMQDLRETAKYISTKDIYWWTEAGENFANGDIAMQIMFTNYASEVLGRRSKIMDKLGYGLVPGGNPLLGGGSLGIAKTCRDPEAALDFMKWYTSDPVASATAALGSVSPCAKTYENYEIIHAFPWLELSKESLALSRTERLPAEARRPFDEKKFLNIIAGVITHVCAGVIETEPALAMLQKKIDKDFNR